jgi:hypothetical protein
MCPKAKCGVTSTHLVRLEEANLNSRLDFPSFHLRTETDTISERHFIFRKLKLYKVYKFSNPKHNIPSS